MFVFIRSKHYSRTTELPPLDWSIVGSMPYFVWNWLKGRTGGLDFRFGFIVRNTSIILYFVLKFYRLLKLLCFETTLFYKSKHILLLITLYIYIYICICGSIKFNKMYQRNKLNSLNTTIIYLDYNQFVKRLKVKLNKTI